MELMVPLWNVIEDKAVTVHDLNPYFKVVNLFSRAVNNDAMDRALFDDVAHNELCQEIVPPVLAAIAACVCHVAREHLLGGIHANPTPADRVKALGTPGDNILRSASWGMLAALCLFHTGLRLPGDRP